MDEYSAYDKIDKLLPAQFLGDRIDHQTAWPVHVLTCERIVLEANDVGNSTVQGVNRWLQTRWLLGE